MAKNSSLTRERSEVTVDDDRPKLQVSEDMYAGIVASAMDAIITVDSKQLITVFNPAAEKIFLYTAAQVIGKPLSMLIPPRFHQAHNVHIQGFAKIGVTSRSMGNLKPLSAIRANGEEFPMEATISHSQSNGDQLFTVIVRDVTERTTAEENARRLATELESANRTFREEIQQRHTVEAALLAAHQELRIRADEMERSTSAKRILTEMSDFLQSCVSCGEARQVATQSLQTLFPDGAGIVYLNREFGGLVETFAKWNSASLTSKEAFEHHECWGLRRGRPHMVRDADATTKCEHLREASEGGSICIPMMAQGQLLGLFHAVWTASSTVRSPSSLESRESLAVSAAETLALAIANVKLREKLREETIRDPLTLLYNRRYMEDVLTREMSRARRAGVPIGIIMIDVDNFKRFNDSFGHPIGDELLRKLGTYLKTRVRPEDIPVRYGGEEFALILPGAPCAIVQARAESLREGFQKVQLGLGGLEQVSNRISLSCGVAVFPEHGASLAGVLQAADEALYEAKRAGKDCVIVSANKTHASAQPQPYAI